jgi:copper chaperone
VVTLKVEGMSCQHCVGHVHKALAGVPGVGTVEVDLAKGEARVSGPVETAALVAAVEAEGYSASVKE